MHRDGKWRYRVAGVCSGEVLSFVKIDFTAELIGISRRYAGSRPCGRDLLLPDSSASSNKSHLFRARDHRRVAPDYPKKSIFFLVGEERPFVVLSYIALHDGPFRLKRAPRFQP